MITDITRAVSVVGILISVILAFTSDNPVYLLMTFQFIAFLGMTMPSTKSKN